MAYFILQKDRENESGPLFGIAENENELNSFNIDKNDYKIIEVTLDNFYDVKYSIKHVEKWNGNTITYSDIVQYFYQNKQDLKKEITDTTRLIKFFTDSNSNHPDYEKWVNYSNYLNNLNLDSISYPLNKSLTKYLSEQGNTSLSILQIP
jgi:hypothetical protein